MWLHDVSVMPYRDERGHLFVAEPEREPFFGRDAPLVALGGIRKAVNILAAGALVAGRGQLQSATAPFELDDILHAALAPRSLADHDSAVMVLQTGGHNLAGAGAVTIDEHHHGKAVEGAVALGLPCPRLG